MPDDRTILDAKNVRLVNAEFPTEKRRVAAQKIQELWPATLTEIADAAADELDEGCTRQHVRNTLDKHFVDDDRVEPIDEEWPELGDLEELFPDADTRYKVKYLLYGFERGYERGREVGSKER